MFPVSVVAVLPPLVVPLTVRLSRSLRAEDGSVTCFFADDAALPVSRGYDLQPGSQLRAKQL